MISNNVNVFKVNDNKIKFAVLLERFSLKSPKKWQDYLLVSHTDVSHKWNGNSYLCDNGSCLLLEKNTNKLKAKEIWIALKQDGWKNPQ